MLLAAQVASLALSTFDKLPQRCKPRVYSDTQREWTPMAAIVAVSGAVDHPDLNCVSLATGTKCLPASQISRCRGLVLHDCHAEILAFRGLNRWLMGEIRHSLECPGHQSEYIEPNGGPGLQWDGQRRPFRLKDGVSMYLFTTTAPCGDASMDLLIASRPDSTPWAEETLAADLATGQPLGRGHFSLLGAVRRKPARGDAEATMSKSCTDKIALKQFTGVLAFPVDGLIEVNGAAFLRGLVTYQDQYDQAGFERAFGRHGRLGRIAGVSGSFFDVHVLPQDFPRFEFEKRAGDQSCRATNISALRVVAAAGQAPVIETLINGVKQGYKQFEDREGKGSIVCRRKMLEELQEISKLIPKAMNAEESLQNIVYSRLKSSDWRSRRKKTKTIVVSQLGQWVSNATEDDFRIAGPDDRQSDL